MREWEINVASGQLVNISVNVSARQFADARLVNDIQDALRETGVDPPRLQLEITESVAASDPRLTITVLSHLKHMGIGVILGDFGIGSSSLSGSLSTRSRSIARWCARCRPIAAPATWWK